MIRDRIFGSLCGIAVGDAIGKQTENLAFADVARWYPTGVQGFEGSPGTVIPRYVGNSKREWRVGETTDDTERTIAVARAIISKGGIARELIGRYLLECTKCVHPGVKSLWEFHQANDPSRIAVRHDGCGAAIRVAPVGMLYEPDRLDAIVSGAYESSIPTHGGSLAIAGAAATAAAVSAAIAGVRQNEIVEHAVAAAEQAEMRWPDHGRRMMSSAIRVVHDHLSSDAHLDAAYVAATFFPDNPTTIVPLALGLATTMESPDAAILLAANVGGDSDSVASIAGSILGATCSHPMNDRWLSVVDAVNDHDLRTVAEGLSRLRH